MNNGTQKLMKLIILAAMVTSLGACAKKSGSSDITPKERTARGQSAPADVGGESRTDSIEPVIVADEDAVATDGGQTQGVPASTDAGTDVDTQAVSADVSVELENRKADARKFSGSADDALRKFLQNKLNTVANQNLQLRNIRSAQGIKNATLKMSLDSAVKNVEMRLTIAGQKDSEAVFKGVLGGDLKADLVTNFNGNLAIATAQCMDQQPSQGKGTCETVHARIQLGAEGRRSFVHIIFRRTNVQTHAAFGDSKCATVACEKLNDLFVTNSLNDKIIHNIEIHPLRFKEAKLETFEIINGKSGMNLKLITRGNELLNIKSDLLTSKATVVASTDVDMRDQHDTTKGQNYTTNLNSMMDQVHLVSNDGKGTLTAVITTFDNQRNVSDKITLQAKRLSRPLAMIIEQINP